MENSIFDKNGFLDWLVQNYTPMESHFAYDMAEAIIRHVVNDCCDDPDRIPPEIQDYMPQVAQDDIARFCKTEAQV